MRAKPRESWPRRVASDTSDLPTPFRTLTFTRLRAHGALLRIGDAALHAGLRRRG